jgi:hypothetical protein
MGLHLDGDLNRKDKKMTLDTQELRGHLRQRLSEPAMVEFTERNSYCRQSGVPVPSWDN